MNKPTKKQHYVWRKYLSAWTKSNTTEGQLFCLRKGKPFPVALMNIAHENYFYGVKELSPKERHIIYQMTVENKTGAQRTNNEQWLNIYCAPFDFLDISVSHGWPILGHLDRKEIENEPTFKNWNIQFIENIHAQIESTAVPYISLLREGSLDFWKNEVDRDKFSFYICNQYFRTKNTRDKLVGVFEQVKNTSSYFSDIRPQNMWIPLSLIFASNLGVNIALNYYPVLLQSDDSYFITGDQPVINTRATFSTLTAPSDLELFYPLSPHSALLLTTNPKYTSGQILRISADEVNTYNMLEYRSSHEMIFAKESEHLDSFLPKSTQSE